ncbi:MAG: prolipoprotein diacylglyceryl transferase [Gomphosphaeria aponina SAG 52.96 = DSM 107014]|uniref:Phosphatidylglycerol--prolipoprotein diacylglyceryl transferase n=1 Tax=Gomphosphaeria aponina SAG 52.96 = DSM 107014 TaxID=1521640 RepID=A0A941GV09_9CHRO|nr:prolipoprotein diacylglyceryl transferase [Gomphosphaeria aponina SAG 52.96 = DSM 107014]
MILAFQFQSPGPIIFELGPIALRWYGLLIASAVLIGIFLSQYLAQRRQVNPDLIADSAIWMIIFALVGARIYYVAFQWEEYAQRPGEIIAIWQGGIAIHGAIIGGSLAGIIFARLNKISFWQLADLIVPSLALGQAIGRWGNFFNSEAFGRPTNLPWKLFIPPDRRPLEYINNPYFHPTFLYESLWNLLVFALLLFLFFWGLRHREKLKVGTITLVYLIAYSSGRIWIEGLRTDSLMLGPLRIAQVVSLVAIAFGLGGLAWLYLAKNNPAKNT